MSFLSEEYDDNDNHLNNEICKKKNHVNNCIGDDTKAAARPKPKLH